MKTVIMEIFDKHAPLNSKRVIGKPAPWLTAELKSLMNERVSSFVSIRNQGTRLIFKIVNPNIVWKPGELQSVYVSILTMHKSFEILEVLDDSLPVSSNDTRINCTEERTYLYNRPHIKYNLTV